MNKNKIIKAPEMEYWVKTQPKFLIEIYDNGSLRRLEHLNADGKSHGLSTNWHENGQKQYEENYVNGEPHGLYTEWHENRQKKYEVNWVHGEKKGLATEWHENGEKKSETNYVKRGQWCEEHGLWLEWHVNGQKQTEGNVVDGKQHGEWKHFDEQGELTKTETYDNGELVKEPNENHRFSHEEVQPIM